MNTLVLIVLYPLSSQGVCTMGEQPVKSDPDMEQRWPEDFNLFDKYIFL